MKIHFIRYKQEYTSVLFLIVAIAVILALYFNIEQLNLKEPLVYIGSDDFEFPVKMKSIYSSGWVFESPNLGAPFVANHYDHTLVMNSNVDTLIAKSMLLFTHNIWLVTNLQYLMSFFLIGIISYFVMKSQDIANIWAVFGSLTFSFLPYIFMRGIAHMNLSAYYFVPLSALLCNWLFTDDTFFNRTQGFFRYRRNSIALLLCLLIANNGTGYYAIFTCFFLLVTGISRGIKGHSIAPIKKSVAIVCLIGGMFLIGLSPHFLYVIQHGKNIDMNVRYAFEGEMYGLKIVQMLFPVNGHGVSYLEELIASYNSTAPIVNENRTAYLGLIGVLGFLFLLLVLLVPYSDRNRYVGKQVRLCSELTVFSVLLSTVGGFSAVIAYAITGRIRGYNRISVFIAYFSISAICLILTEFKKSVNYKTVNGIICLIFVFGLWEQIPTYKDSRNLDSYASDRAFVQTIENTVAPGAMIAQLPYHAYPEGGEMNGLPDYRLFAGYLNSNNLRWTYGAPRGREADTWQKIVLNMPRETMLQTLVATGFQGLYIERGAYTYEELTEMENDITSILVQLPWYSGDGRLAFYDLSAYTSAWQAMHSVEEQVILREEALRIGQNAQTWMAIDLPRLGDTQILNNQIILLPQGMQYGPYAKAEAGTYLVTFWGENLESAHISAGYNEGKMFVPIHEIARNSDSVTYQITLLEDVHDLELITANNSASSISLGRISMVKS